MVALFLAFVSTSLFFTWLSVEKITDLHESCGSGQQYATTASQNAATLATTTLTPFGRTERGWQIYAPQVAATIGTSCAPETKRFAATLATWQARNRLRPTGAVDAATLGSLKSHWQQARPFIANFEPGRCPPAAPDESLADIQPWEGWLGKTGKLDASALAALRRMVAAARAADPRIAADRNMLTIVSAFRSPAYDAARCTNGRCNGIAKARCSAHRTGTAVDLFVGAAPGHGPVDSADANRLYLSRTPAYRWLVANAARFGFVNYVFEPWHWEWVGSPTQTTG
ncbi:MAG: D-alanyl-D-alanine carboxypeptidase family protein [Micropepsaceae bacterium]